VLSPSIDPPVSAAPDHAAEPVAPDIDRVPRDLDRVPRDLDRVPAELHADPRELHAVSPERHRAIDPVARLLDIGTIYFEPAVAEHARGREILARFPAAERVEVASHWRIPGLFGNEGNVERWNEIKRTVLVLGVKKGLRLEPNGRSTDFLAPSTANGCAMACAYCYVPRNKGFANPISLFVNIDEITTAISRHAAKLGPKSEPNQVDAEHWVYDIGVNSDCSVDAALCDNVRDLVALFRETPNAKGSFATKLVNPALLDYDPQRRTRIRFSLMPAETGRLLDVRTSPMSERIAAMTPFFDAGWEVQINFSPVVVTEGWLERYDELFREIDDTIAARVKAELACEVIFLTHNERLHEVNLGWHPRAEDLLWTPQNQEAKVSQGGGHNVRYRHGFKGRMVRQFLELLERRLPYCRVRYAF
jgi:spore photoproduct lyase